MDILSHMKTFFHMAEYLKAEADALKALEDSLAEIPGEYEALLEELTEEDKETFNIPLSSAWHSSNAESI